jgi:hypothetical protein
MPVASVGLVKKAASGVLAIFPCSRTQRTLRPQKRLWPCWTDFFNRPKAMIINAAKSKFVLENFNYSTLLQLNE